MHFVTINAGSSSLKVSLFEAQSEHQIAQASARIAGSELHLASPLFASEILPRQAFEQPEKILATLLEKLAAAYTAQTSCPLTVNFIAHRVVHGAEYTEPLRLTPTTILQLESLCELAPLHNPPSLKLIKAAQKLHPQLIQYAVFDTTFHHTMLPQAKDYAIPRQWRKEWGIKRFGFHGLSFSYCAERAQELLANTAQSQKQLRLVICHLGSGCSAAAVKDGKCLDTTMGFTPLEGLVMGTRCGNIDAGAILYLQQHRRLSAEELNRILNQESGLSALSGVSSDMQLVLQAVEQGNEQAKAAIDLYTYRVRQAIGAFAATLGGIDALVFTAGVGENSAEIREQICLGLKFLGVTLDQSANLAFNELDQPDGDVASRASSVRILVIKTREDLSMLRAVKRALPSLSP